MKPSLIVAGVLGLAGTALAQSVELTHVANGAAARLGGYTTQKLSLATEKPASVKRLPEKLTDLRFAVLRFGPGPEQQTFAFVISSPAGKDPQVIVDANGNGDLTDDPPVTLTTSEYNADGKKKLLRRNGSVPIQAKYEGKAVPCGINFYLNDPNDNSGPGTASSIFYYRDYAKEGELTIGSAKYAVMLSDDLTTGDFRGKQGTSNPSGVRIFIDLDHNKSFKAHGEAFDIRDSIEIGGKQFQVNELTASGTSLKLESFKKKQLVIKPGDMITPGQFVAGKCVIPFEEKALDGKTIKFPQDYQGKVVLLDFWATWCGPCVGELPNVIATYNKYKKQGFEVLGVTLDNKPDEQKVRGFLTQKKMEWPQIFDGGGWKAKLAKVYGVNSIPRAILVDGDTGKILEPECRGAALETAVKNALAKKKK